MRTPFYGSEVASQLVSAALFVALCVYLWRGSDWSRINPSRDR
jgi:hypothetical protein